MDKLEHHEPRPLLVTLALALFVANQLPDFVLGALRGNYHSPYFYIIFVALLAVVFLPPWFIFHGKNWARWFLAAIFFAGFCASLYSFITSYPPNSALTFGLSILKTSVNIIALGALFLPPSNRWFRSCKTYPA